MLIPDVFFSFIIALIGSFVAALIIRRGLPRKGFLLFFLVIFLATWAGGIWGRADDFAWVPRTWLSFLFSGVVAVFIFSVLAPKKPRIDRNSILDKKETMQMLEKIEQEREVEELAYITVNVFFWIVLLLLISAIIVRYL